MTGLLTTFFVVAIVQAVCGSDVVASSKPYQPVVVEGGQYFVHLAIGTPPQRFFAQVSTTTSYSWVPDSSCLCPKICSAGGCKYYSLISSVQGPPEPFGPVP